jgi:hypothetical protein
MIEPFNPIDSLMYEELPSWRSELEQEYIHLFETYEGEETENSYYKKGQVLRGIECGIGWKEPVIQLLKSLDWNLNKNCYIENPDKNSDKKYIKDPNASIKIFQIKEKFGEARCYVQANSKRLQELAELCVAKFEATCRLTCQSCGTVGKDFISKRGMWIVCLCEECKNKYNRDQLDFDDYLRSLDSIERKNNEC